MWLVMGIRCRINRCNTTLAYSYYCGWFGPLAMRGTALRFAWDRKLRGGVRDHEIVRDCHWTPFSWQCDTRRPLVLALSFSFIFEHSGQCSLSSICKRPRLIVS